MNPSQDKQDLLDAARAAVTDAQAKAEARAQERTVPKRGRGVGLGVGLAAAAVSLYLAAVRPAWFLTPPPPPDSPAVQEASIRLTLVREAQRITTWRAARGRLPGDLGEIGTPIAGLAYDRLNDSVFTLSLPFGTTLVTLRSTDSLAVFLGPAVGTVSARVSP